MKKFWLIFAVNLLCSTAHAQAPWNLPAELTDSNTSISFSVDSTWHLIEGTTSGIEGRVWLEDSKDYHSIAADIRIPVKTFDTSNSSRDERMLEVIHAEQNRYVRFELLSAENLCNPVKLEQNESCPTLLKGNLSISGVKKPTRIPATVKQIDGNYIISGEFALLWEAFGVEDPSILIARLDKQVTVKFELTLTKKT